MEPKAVGSGSLPATLFVVFLILRLTGVIDWSWWWVTAPLWIPLAVALFVFVPTGLYLRWKGEW